MAHIGAENFVLPHSILQNNVYIMKSVLEMFP